MGRPPKYDLVGQRFGKLRVILYLPGKSGFSRRWMCVCDCGTVCAFPTGSLIGEQVSSCGCNGNIGNTQHGGTKRNTYLYYVWCQMRQRCSNANVPGYYRYGGRGITVCSEWQSFPVFEEWAMSHGYTKGLHLDRINNDLGYCPNNCQFITKSENSQKMGRELTEESRNNHRRATIATYELKRFLADYWYSQHPEDSQ
jgi:hypothetical protein